jgi:phosphinothricin acetyltransferase
VGVYHHVGYKIGAWHDVGWWSLELQPTQPDPAPPRSLPQVVGTPAWQLALTAGLRHLRV